MSAKKAIVVGAGVSGLTASYQLQKAGFDVTILEADDKACGRVQTIEKNGYLLDIGADVNSSSYYTYLELVKELGLEQYMVDIPTTVGTIVDGKVRHMDAASTLSLATTDTWSLKTKLAIARGMKKVAHNLEGIDSRFLYKKAHLDDPHRSAENIGLRYFGADATDYMIDPLGKLVAATGAERLSIVDLYTGLALANDKIWTFLGGAARLAKVLEEKANIKFQCPVERVEEGGDGVVVTYRNAAGESVTEQVDGCVLATMYETSIKIYPPLQAMSPELAENLSFMQVNKILLGYDRVADSKAHTVQVPSVEDDEILCIFLDHNKAPDRAPKGHSLMDIQTDLRFFEKTTTMSDDDLIAWARGKVEKFFPELAGHFDGMSHVQRWPRLGNMNSPGYYANVAKLLDRLDPNSRIQVGGDLFTKAYQDGAATWGKIAAENLIKALA